MVLFPDVQQSSMLLNSYNLHAKCITGKKKITLDILAYTLNLPKIFYIFYKFLTGFMTTCCDELVAVVTLRMKCGFWRIISALFPSLPSSADKNPMTCKYKTKSKSLHPNETPHPMPEMTSIQMLPEQDLHDMKNCRFGGVERWPVAQC